MILKPIQIVKKKIKNRQPSKPSGAPNNSNGIPQRKAPKFMTLVENLFINISLK
jgi:hypothetical protein